MNLLNFPGYAAADFAAPHDRFVELLGVDTRNLAGVHGELIESKLRTGKLDREPPWSEAVAVGRRSFVEGVKEELGSRARYRTIHDREGMSVLREEAEAYKQVFGGEIPRLAAI